MQHYQPPIGKIELKNFKCHLSFCEELNCLTILAGENSAGKSSVIQSVLLFDSATQSTDGSVFTLNVRGINLGNASGMITESSGSDKTDIILQINGHSFLLPMITMSAFKSARARRQRFSKIYFISTRNEWDRELLTV